MPVILGLVGRRFGSHPRARQADQRASSFRSVTAIITSIDRTRGRDQIQAGSNLIKADIHEALDSPSAKMAAQRLNRGEAGPGLSPEDNHMEPERMRAPVRVRVIEPSMSGAHRGMYGGGSPGEGGGGACEGAPARPTGLMRKGRFEGCCAHSKLTGLLYPLSSQVGWFVAARGKPLGSLAGS